MNRVNSRQAASLISEQQEFTNSTGSLRASRWSSQLAPPRGRLPSAEARQLRADRPSYVVWSYDTPIAWVDSGGSWVIPDVKYSTTTSKHQNLVRMALR